uniref:Uncharacterized protein n=1 Tax=Rhizophora mucronata TaxID=61149 RepID=A0A2P2Q124_RHIMU
MVNEEASSFKLCKPLDNSKLQFFKLEVKLAQN